ncbi:MAG: glycosyltransferase family 4 protein [Aquisalimonadaceae bacterium]
MTDNMEIRSRPALKGGLLFLLNSLTVGGSERKVVRIANALSRRGLAMHIAYLNGPDSLLEEIDAGIPVIDLQRRHRFSVGALVRLAGYVSGSRVHRLVAVNLHPLLYASLAARLVLPRPDTVALVNTSELRNNRDRRFMGLYAPLLRRAQRIVFGSRGQQRAWIRRYNLHAGRCVCILNGIDARHFSPPAAGESPAVLRRRIGIRPGDFVIGTVGAMRPEKGHKDLLRAAAMLRRDGVPATVLLVGDGPCRAELMRCATDTGVSGATIFHGQAKDVRPLLAVMDVFVLPSTAVETFSNAALEAMACARAVLLSDVGGAREMVTGGENGLIYPPGDTAALVGALRMLHGDPQLRACLGANARARVINEFSFDSMLSSYQRWVVPAQSAAAGLSCSG